MTFNTTKISQWSDSILSCYLHRNKRRFSVDNLYNCSVNLLSKFTEQLSWPQRFYINFCFYINAHVYNHADCASDVPILSAVVEPEYYPQPAGHHLHSASLGVSTAWCQHRPTQPGWHNGQVLRVWRKSKLVRCNSIGVRYIHPFLFPQCPPSPFFFILYSLSSLSVPPLCQFLSLSIRIPWASL